MQYNTNTKLSSKHNILLLNLQHATNGIEYSANKRSTTIRNWYHSILIEEWPQEQPQDHHFWCKRIWGPQNQAAQALLALPTNPDPYPFPLRPFRHVHRQRWRRGPPG